MSETPKPDPHSFNFKWGNNHISATGWGIIVALIGLLIVLGVPAVKLFFF